MAVDLGRRSRSVLIGLCLVLASAPDTRGEEQMTQPHAGIRLATPGEVAKQLKEEEEQINAGPRVDGLARRLVYYLRTRFPRLSVLTHDEATEENLGFATSELRQPSPFICFGDFDGNGLEDAAVLLRENPSHARSDGVSPDQGHCESGRLHQARLCRVSHHRGRPGCPGNQVRPTADHL